MTYNGWPCDKAPTIHCVPNRSFVNELMRIVGIGIITGTIGEDVLTGGAGLADDPACIAAGIMLICPPSPEPIGPGPNPIQETEESGCPDSGRPTISMQDAIYNRIVELCKRKCTSEMMELYTGPSVEAKEYYNSCMEKCIRERMNEVSR